MTQRQEVSGGAIAEEAGMATRDQSRNSGMAVVRRQPARMVHGRPEGGRTGLFEIICCVCGDYPDLDYSEISPELRRVRRPYPIADGLTAYAGRLGLHDQPAAASMGRGRMLADRR